MGANIEQSQTVQTIWNALNAPPNPPPILPMTPSTPGTTCLLYLPTYECKLKFCPSSAQIIPRILGGPFVGRHLCLFSLPALPIMVTYPSPYPPPTTPFITAAQCSPPCLVHAPFLVVPHALTHGASILPCAKAPTTNTTGFWSGSPCTYSCIATWGRGGKKNGAMGRTIGATMGMFASVR